MDITVKEDSARGNTPLAQRLNEQETLISMLREVVKELEVKLEMVLGPLRPRDGSPEAEPDAGSSSALVSSLDDHNERLVRIRRHLEDIQERIEV